MKAKYLGVLLAGVFASVAGAQTPLVTADVSKAKALLESLQSGQQDLPAEWQGAVQSGMSAAKSVQAASEALLNGEVPPSAVFSREGAAQMVQAAQSAGGSQVDAFIAGLPVRDQAYAEMVLKGTGVDTRSPGRLYYFVSRAMPDGLLRGYALEALRTGATLVVKGPRKGGTIKDFLTDLSIVMETEDGSMLAPMEMNPNLYDMFQVDVVPTIIWTNQMGLGDIGSGCKSLPARERPMMSVLDYKGEYIDAPTPQCLPSKPGNYYKISGPVTTGYALEAFAKAGLPKLAVAEYTKKLQGDAKDPNKRHLSGAMMPMVDSLTLNDLPRATWAEWREKLKTHRVTKVMGNPSFSLDGADDPVYREHLRGLAGATRVRTMSLVRYKDLVPMLFAETCGVAQARQWYAAREMVELRALEQRYQKWLYEAFTVAPQDRVAYLDSLPTVTPRDDITLLTLLTLWEQFQRYQVSSDALPGVVLLYPGIFLGAAEPPNLAAP